MLVKRITKVGLGLHNLLSKIFQILINLALYPFFGTLEVFKKYVTKNSV